MTQFLKIHRYSKSLSLGSTLDPLDDVVGLLESLTSVEYVRDICVNEHGLSSQEGKVCSRQIVSHARVGLEYVRLALHSGTDLRFLPGYYGILNLIKIYVILGPYRSELESQRWHGASYDVNAKDSRSLLTEKINIHPKGAISLFYKTVTGQGISSVTTLKMADVYRYIAGISGEFSVITKQPTGLAHIRFERPVDLNKSFKPRIHIEPFELNSLKGQQLKMLRGFKKVPSRKLIYEGSRISISPGNRASDAIRNQINPFLLYAPIGGHAVVPISGRELLLPEELPIILLFFHMGSVVRYKPEFLGLLKDSRYWPLISAASRHSMLDMLHLVWSYVHKSNLTIG